jgi:UDP-MurNAc hydroxylase
VDGHSVEIEWVNHASFVVSEGPVSLICDPWIEGAVFNTGWKHLSPTTFRYSDFSRITHIFFSHEHPDHFYPPNVRNIPEEYRPRITVLFHTTRDKRVLMFCRSLGFNVLELPEKKWVSLSSGLEVLCGSQDLMDSWLVVRANKTVVNVNDCLTGPGDLADIRSFAPDPDVMLTQFSYASWVGNPDDTEAHRREAQAKYGQMEMQIRALKPIAVIPCASFVWFSHGENAYMNASANRVGDVHDFLGKLGVRSIVLYPGDRWKVGDFYSNVESLARYSQDYASLPSRELTTCAPILLPSLIEAQKAFFRKAFHRNNRWLLYLMPRSSVAVEDLGLCLELSFRHIFRQTQRAPDIILSSDSLNYCLGFDWGGNTLEVNGRYRVPAGGKPMRFFNYFRPAAYNAAGYRFDVPLAYDIIEKKLVKRMRA